MADTNTQPESYPLYEYTSRMANTLIAPNFVLENEISGVFGTELRRELSQLIKCYSIYEMGTEFRSEGSNNDYVPSNLRYMPIHGLIDKEARFMFAKSPDFFINVEVDEDMSVAQKKTLRKQQSQLQSFLDKVLEENCIENKLIQAAKDCFIGKRVALFLNVNETGVKITFEPSLSFTFETDPNDASVLTKIISFYSLSEGNLTSDQRIFKKKYYMAEDGYCHVIEEVYDGAGNLVETITPDSPTRFTYIPAFVIINDGLTGDLKGVSEVEMLMRFESEYSRFANADQDAGRKGMNPVVYTIDASPNTTAGLSRAAGAYWDLATDPACPEGKSATAGVLDTPMTYSAAIKETLSRLNGAMHELLSVPNVSPEALKGIVTSGKTLKAIYWDLIVRCDDKMKVWGPALRFLVRAIIDSAYLYPEFVRRYLTGPLPVIPFSVVVENQYPLPEDESEEKQVDLAEVAAQTMSKKSYMKKWRKLTDDEAMDELHQMALERQLLEDSFMGTNPAGDSVVDEDDDPEDDPPKNDPQESDPTPEGL